MSEAERSASVKSIVLASASPRRHDLLGLLGIPFRVDVADVDEQVRPGESPEALTLRLAQTKALTIARSRVDAVVLAADTIVVLDGVILNKPRDGVEARAMLGSLRGRAHRVLTGLALAVRGEVAWSSVVETTVWMRSYGDDEVERYIRSGSPLDKAGGYGIQDAPFRPVERVDGCYANVVGLPLCEVRRALAATGGVDLGSAATPDDACDLCDRARGLQSRNRRSAQDARAPTR